MNKVNFDKNLVVKHNELITASYAMTVNEQRLLLACISQINTQKQSKDNASAVYSVTVEQARDLFYTKGDQRNAYRDLEDASERLFERKARIRLGGERELLTRFVQSIVFDPDKGSVELRFADEIRPYISQLEDNFTRYRLENVAQLTSNHAIRIYELIVSWSFETSYKEMTIDEFKSLLGLRYKYKQFGDFRTRVVEPAVSQINESTDFYVDIAFQKKKRSYHWIQLEFNKKQQHKEADNAQRIINESRKIAYQKRLEEERENKIKNMRLPADGTILKSGDKIFQIEGDAVRMVGEYRAYIPPQALKKMLFNGEVTELAESDQSLDEYRDEDGYLDLFGEF